jgi:hypothetical protein
MRINEGAYLIPTMSVQPGLKVYINNKYYCRTLPTSVAVTPIKTVKPGDVIKCTKSSLFSGEQTLFEKKLYEMEIDYNWIPQLEYKKELVRSIVINESIFNKFIEEADYIGGLEDGKPEGYGRAYYKSSYKKTLYEGEWKNGKFQGIGRIFTEFGGGNIKYRFENGKQIEELTGKL